MLSVCFATRNRAATLARVLEAFTSLRAPPGGWRLLVVDNGSTDATAEVLGGFAGRLPLQALQQPQPGKNRALNTALPHLQGELAVFTDDDVIPAPDWLLRLHEAALAHPTVTLFGGTVIPIWPSPPPAWLTTKAVEFSVLYAEQRRPSGPCDASDIFGPNMAVRRAIFAAGTRFAEHVGPNAQQPFYAMGSETELLRRLYAAGHRGVFVAEAEVGHIIRPEQMEERWILERAYRYGLGEGKHAAARLTTGPLLLRRLAYGLAAQALAALPVSARRLRIRYRDRWLAGVVAGRRGGGSPPAPA